MPERKQPPREPDGNFGSFQMWVNKATSWIGGENAACFDVQGRRCRMGADFMRARDEGTFPVYYWLGEGDETPSQQRKSQRLAEKRRRYP